MATQKQIEAAVRCARLYAGSLEWCSTKDQQRLYNRLKTAMRPLEKVAADAWDQVAARAASLGPIRPTPGKDF